MMKDERWKDRLAFVSGNVLVFALFILAFWPIAASYQTGLHIRAWTMNLPQEGVKAELWFFWSLTALLAAALLSISLSIIHILSRGIWLGTRSEDKENAKGPNGGRATLSDWCLASYRGNFLLIFIFAFFLLLTIFVLLSAGFEKWLVTEISLSVKAAGWVARMSVMVIFVGLLCIFQFFPRKSPFTRRFFHFLIRHGLVGGKLHIYLFFGLLFFWLVVVESCYTLTVNVDRRLYIKDQHPVAQVTVRMGGATSDPRTAKFYLIDNTGNQIQKLNWYSIGDGYYLAAVQISSLREGSYHVAVEYPHLTISAVFPYLKPSVTRLKGFAVIKKK